MFISVDLPEPDWPIMATISPRWMSRSTPLSTETLSPPAAKRRTSPEMAMMGSPEDGLRPARGESGCGSRVKARFMARSLAPDHHAAAQPARTALARALAARKARAGGVDHLVALGEAGDDLGGDVVVEAHFHPRRAGLLAGRIVDHDH